MNYLFDSSSILEIIDNKEFYDKFKGLVIVANTLNLAEVYNVLLRAHGEQTTDYWAENLYFNFLEITEEIAIEASKFRYKHQNENISYADCIGYITAKKNKLIFITGDSRFKDKENVEFIN